MLQSHKTTLDEMSNEIATHGFDIEWDITNVNCAVHTLQLGTKDVLDMISTKHQNFIKLCRKITKFLRLPKSWQAMHAAKIH